MMPGWLSVAVVGVLLQSVCVAVRVEPSGECPSGGDLYNALQNISSDTVLELESGVHCLNGTAIVSGVSNITIAGTRNGSSPALISCSSGAGLAVLDVSRLCIINIEIRGCGLEGEGLVGVVNQTRELVQFFFTVPAETRVGLWLASVRDLVMEGVVIANTSGLGVAGINIVGQSYLKNCRFYGNRQRQRECGFPDSTSYVSDLGERIGGGAYFLFQDFVESDVTTCTELPVYSLEITDSRFDWNTECSVLYAVELFYRESREAKEVGYTIGGGGGMGLMFAQACYSVNVTTSHTSFEDNSATFGSGVHVGMFQGVSHSYAVFDSCQFTRNGYQSRDFNIDYPTSGGAIGMYNDLVSPNPDVHVFIHDRRIGLVIRNTNFTENGAILGGAVTIVSLVTTAVSDLTDVAHFFIENCLFGGNRATRGSAVYIEEQKIHGRLLGVQVTVQDVRVTGNKLENLGQVASLASADSSAVVDIKAINLTLTGECVFEGNIGSALQGTNSLIGLAGNISITNNTGLYGAGITLQTSFIVVLPNSSLSITDNVARVYGGGLYVNQVTDSPLLNMFDCFLYFNYDQFQFCGDCDFTSSVFSVTIANNSALLAGTVFGSALLTCPWSQPLQLTYDTLNVLEILNTHFSEYFHFEPDPTGIDNVRTPVSQVTIEDQLTQYSLAPGEFIHVPIRPSDSLGQSISTILGVYADLDQSVSQSFVPALGPNIITGYSADSNLSTPLSVFGAENITTNLVVYSLDFGYRPAQVEIRVQVSECPVGFDYSGKTLRCECSDELLESGVVCDSTNLTFRVPTRLWVGPVDSSTFAVAECIRGLCEPGEAIISVRNNSVDFDQQCRSGLNRGGILCSSCLDGYTNVFGSPRCKKCTNRSVPVLMLFMLMGALLIAFLVVFHFNLSSGYLNGVLFWANIVDLYQRVLAPSQSGGGVTVLANWLTLNWGIETCFHEGMSALEQNWWELSFPLYLFLLMVILRSVFKCCSVKPKTAFATIEAIATLLIMCYISILQSSFQLIGTVEITTEGNQKLVRWMADPTVPYFRGAHGFLAFIACVLILVYIIPIPLLFLAPTLLYSNKYLKKYKPIYDAFWNPFKPRFRFWLGLRLIFRWVPFIIASFTTPPTSTFVTGFMLVLLLFLQLQLQPFKSEWVNAIDSLFLLNLSLLFLGSLFYTATVGDGQRTRQISVMHRATSYTTALVILAYLAITAVFVYRVCVRFPKLMDRLLQCYVRCCGKKMKKIVLHVPQSVSEEPNYVDGVSTDTDRVNPIIRAVGPRVISHTSFREPLLDEGSVEIHTYTTTVPPTSPSSPFSHHHNTTT